MKKFKNKETGAIYIAKTQSIVESFEKNPLYIEVEDKTQKAPVESSEINVEINKEEKSNNKTSKKGQK